MDESSIQNSMNISLRVTLDATLLLRLINCTRTRYGADNIDTEKGGFTPHLEGETDCGSEFNFKFMLEN